MKRISLVIVLLFTLGMADARTSASKIIKVPPHLLHKQANHTLSPSLLERDAYQATLRSNPLHFDHLISKRIPEQRSGFALSFAW